MLDDAKKAILGQVLGALSDERYRERAAEAADKFVREKLGLTWAEVAEAVSMAALRNEKGATRDEDRTDPDWFEIFDRQGNTSYGRWMWGRAFTIRRRNPPRGRPMWFVAIDGRTLRTEAGVQLFEDLAEAKEVAEEAAGIA
jgi:hypothetical protein